MPLRRLATAVLIALTVVACGDSATPAAGPSHRGDAPARTGRTSAGGNGSTARADGHRPCGWRARPAYRHVIWIWLENRTYESVLGGSAAAPDLARYARDCGVATDYQAITHPSLPNYVAAVAGSTGGITSDCSPTDCPVSLPSLYAQVTASGRRWAGYAESMATACDRGSYDDYAARHNPAVYFPSLRADCLRHDRPMGGARGAFAAALAADRLPAFTFVTPNLCHDGHDCSTSVADRWLGGWLDRIVASPAYAAGRTVVFVTWDEGVGEDNRVATVVVGPTVPPATRSGRAFTHYSLLRTTEQILGLPFLGSAATAPSMRRDFHL